MIDRVLEVKGNAWYRNVLSNTFGFGQHVGIEVPGESAGLLPRIGKRHPNGTLEWSLPTPYSLMIGHNILVTSVQLLRAYAILANGGYFVKPTLVRKIVRESTSGQKELIWEKNAQEIYPKVLSDKIVNRVKHAMKFTTKLGGTGRLGDIPGYSEAGKTGTSEKIVDGKYSYDRYFSTFIGYAPVESSRVVILVSINEPEKKYIPGIGKNHNASVCCAPVFRELGRRVLEYLEVEPDDPHGYPYGDPRRNREKADWYQETQALRNLYQEWNGS
jgi:cell division protein FtsI (penicillin-binding protein 3)